MRGAVTLLIVGAVIATFGSSAVVLYAFRRRVRERFLLWFGLFSILYGIALVVRNSAFRLGFGQPRDVGLSVERFLTLSMIVPGLLLFEEFYGRGWRSSIRWVSGIYCALVAVAMSGAVSESTSELLQFPGTTLVILVPVVLTLGRIAGYRPPLLANSPTLFAGLLAFFCGFAVDRVRHTKFGDWQSVEPYGFLALVICLWYVTAQRVIVDERRLVSLSDEMRAATKIQEAILPARPPSIENVRIGVRYAPMTAVAGDLYDFPPAPPNCIAVFVADVVGHGVPAALVAAMVKVAVSAQRGNDGEPASIIAGLNAVLCNEARKQYATAVYLCLDAVNEESGDIRLQHIRLYSAIVATRPNNGYWKCWEELGFSSECERMRHMTTTSFLLTLETGFYSIRMASWKQRIAPESHLATQRFPLLLKKSRTLEPEQFVDVLLKEVLA